MPDLRPQAAKLSNNCRRRAIRRTGQQGRPRRRARSATDLTLQLQIVLCVAIIGCISMALPLAHLVSFGTDFGLSLNDAGWIFSATLTAAFVSRILFMGLLSDRFGGLWALFCFSALQAAMVALLAYAVPYSCFMSWDRVRTGLRWHLPGLRRHHPRICRLGSRPSTGIVFLFGAVSMGVGSWMGGAIFDAYDNYDLAF